MEIRKIREEMSRGRSVFDLPLRVTFYARVSTDREEQLNSLENQVQYYTELIQSKPGWTFVPGYIDEGISGTSTRKRESFNRMIRDAGAGCFDFIITKEISRFSRSTLDSIRFTQQLLEHNVGVLFQNDGINTLDPDSEFRLVVMAGVAQDEVRKLSERLKFGFRQAIRNGHVLGNDSLYGYVKKDCVLTVHEQEAQIIRTIFRLYANHGMGTRRISGQLTDMGYTSREGNAFNTLTIRHILTNPKYKGWYCGRKSRTIDYRTGKKVYLDESEWVMYPDPTIPVIVPEELWDRANALYRERSRQSAAHAAGACFHNRYPYSGKIFCAEHQTAFHRRTLASSRGVREIWQCSVYRRQGRKGCAAPQVSSAQLDEILAKLLGELILDKNAVAEYLLSLLRRVMGSGEEAGEKRRLEEEMTRLQAKKDRLLELSIAGALSDEEFRRRNDGFNTRLQVLQSRREALHEERENVDMAEIRQTLDRELGFSEGINSVLAASVLDKVVVKSTDIRNEIQFLIRLKPGHAYEVFCAPGKSSPRITPLKNTTQETRTRRI